MDDPRAKSLSARFRRTFSRRTTSGRFIAEIDGLRFPAIAIVALGHLSAFFTVRGNYAPSHAPLDRLATALPNYAPLGVVLFFIISGFVLALPFAQHYRGDGARVSLRSYFLRRLTRLEPPYLLTLAALMGLEIVAGMHHIAGRTETPGEVLRHGAASAAYLHNLIFATMSTINPPAWSLEVEVQFYILVPMLALVFRVHSAAARRSLIVIGALAAIAVQLTAGPTHPRIALSIVGHLQFFLVGFVLADLYLFAEMRDLTGTYRWDLVSIAGWVAIFALWHGGPWATVALPFVALTTFVAVFRGRMTNRLFCNGWITTLGGMCYSIYLIHLELIAALARLIRHVVRPTGTLWVDFLVEGVPVLLVTLVVCIAFYYLVERPCMDRQWPRRLFAFLRGAPELRTHVT